MQISQRAAEFCSMKYFTSFFYILQALFGLSNKANSKRHCWSFRAAQVGQANMLQLQL